MNLLYLSTIAILLHFLIMLCMYYRLYTGVWLLFTQSCEDDVVIGTLNGSTKTQLYYSYLRLARHIKIKIHMKELSACEGLSGRLQILSHAVKEELKKRSQWLLIVDDLTSELFETTGMFLGLSYIICTSYYVCRDGCVSSTKWR